MSAPYASSRRPHTRYSKSSSDQVVAIFVKLVEGKIDVNCITDWIRTGDIRALTNRYPELCNEEVTRVHFAKFFLLVIKFLLDKRIVEDRSQWKKPEYTARPPPPTAKPGYTLSSETYEANFPSIGQGDQHLKKKQLLNRVKHPSESSSKKIGSNRTGRRVTPTQISLEVDHTKTWPPACKNDDPNGSLQGSGQNSLQSLVEPQKASVEVMDGGKQIKLTRDTTRAFNSAVRVYIEILKHELCPSITSELQYFLNMLFEKTSPFSSARKHISKQNISTILALKTFRHKEDCMTFAIKVVSSKLDVLKYSDVSMHSLIEILPDEFPEFKQPLIELTKLQIGVQDCSYLLSLVSMFQSLNFALEQQNCTNNNILVINEFESLASEWHHKLVLSQDEIIKKVNKVIEVCNNEVGSLTILAEKFVGRLIYTALTINQQNRDKLKLLNCRVSQNNENVNVEFNYDETFFRDFLAHCFTMSPTLVIFIKQTLIFSIKKLTSEIQELNITVHPFLSAGCGCTIEYIKILKCLGKFLGYIEFKPFCTIDAASDDLLDRYIIFRSETPPPLDFIRLFKDACQTGTLGVIIPLIVEFITTGDILSLRLPYISGIYALLLTIKTAAFDRDGTRFITITFDEPKETCTVRLSIDTFNFLSLQIGKAFTTTGFHEENFYCLMESIFHEKICEKSIIENSIFVSQPLIQETCSKFNAINSASPAYYRNLARHITPTVISNEDAETSDDIEAIKEKLGASFLSGYKGMNTIIDFLLTRALQVCEREFPIIYIQHLNEPLISNGNIIPPEDITIENPIAVKLVQENASKLKMLMTEKAEVIKKRNLEAFPLLLDLNLPETVVTTAQKLLTFKLDGSIKTLIDQKYPDENIVPILIKEYQEKKPKPERDVAEIAPLLIRLQSYIYGITIKNDFTNFDEHEIIALFNQVKNQASEAADYEHLMSTLYILSMDLVWSIAVNSPEKITHQFISEMITFWKEVRPSVPNQCEMRILCPRNIQMALASPAKARIPKAVTVIFQHVIEKNCLTFQEFEEQSLSLFHSCWEKHELQFIYQLLGSIREGLKNIGGSDDRLLLEWMVDTIHDLQGDFQ